MFDESIERPSMPLATAVRSSQRQECRQIFTTNGDNLPGEKGGTIPRPARISKTFLLNYFAPKTCPNRPAATGMSRPCSRVTMGLSHGCHGPGRSPEGSRPAARVGKGEHQPLPRGCMGGDLWKTRIERAAGGAFSRGAGRGRGQRSPRTPEWRRSLRPRIPRTPALVSSGRHPAAARGGNGIPARR